MTRDDIIHMAREAGCLGPGKGGDPYGLWEPDGEENVTELMFRFAALVAAAERRAIWNILFDYAGRDDLSDSDQSLIKHLAELIRAREQS